VQIYSKVEELEELNQSLRNRDKMKDDAIAQLSDQLMAISTFYLIFIFLIFIVVSHFDSHLVYFRNLTWLIDYVADMADDDHSIQFKLKYTK
jgi:uncharacterized membrane protein